MIPFLDPDRNGNCTGNPQRCLMRAHCKYGLFPLRVNQHARKLAYRPFDRAAQLPCAGFTQVELAVDQAGSSYGNTAMAPAVRQAEWLNPNTWLRVQDLVEQDNGSYTAADASCFLQLRALLIGCT